VAGEFLKRQGGYRELKEGSENKSRRDVADKLAVLPSILEDGRRRLDRSFHEQIRGTDFRSR
jgi:hypothetical protein